jgi:hypothetical protein
MPRIEGLPPWLTTDQVLSRLADDELGDSHWTYELAAAAFANVQDRGDMISTTAMLGCVRSEIVGRKEPYIGDLGEMWAALRGTLMHRTLELSTPESRIAEVRFSTTVDGIEVTCAPDHLTQTALLDYKVPADQNSVPMTYLYGNQVEQLMLNAFICRNAESWDREIPFDTREHPVEKVGIVFIGPKRPKVILYKKSETVTRKNGTKGSARFPYVWNDKETLELFRPRLHLFSNGLQSYPDWPQPWTDPDTGHVWTAEEVWGGDEGWECPGWPVCKFTTCLARRKALTW